MSIEYCRRCNRMLPNGSRGYPQCFALLLVYFAFNLGTHEHQVGSGVNRVRYQVFVLLFHFLCVLENGLRVFLRYLVGVVARLFDLFDLLHGLELDQQDDRINLVGMQSFDRVQVDIDDAVLVLKKRVYSGLFFSHFSKKLKEK